MIPFGEGSACTAAINHRSFHRIDVAIPVHYRFLPTGTGVECPGPESFEGSTRNLSGGGLLLEGEMIEQAMLGELIMGRLLLGIEFTLPGEEPDEPVKAIARVSWMEGLDEKARTLRLGLGFEEITTENRDRIIKHVIRFTV